MASTSQAVEKDISSDKTTALINAQLDQLDAALMMRGRNAVEMRAGYQSQLFWYQEMLSVMNLPTLSQEQLIKKQKEIYGRMKSGIKAIYHLYELKDPKQCAAKLDELSQSIRPLVHLIEKIPAEAYDQTFHRVRETLITRTNYFDALRRALPTGRYSYPLDVAWFHRTNPTLIASYLLQHPANKVLSMPEEEHTKIECNFKEFKMGLVGSCAKIINLCSGKSFQFFEPGDDVAENYLRYHLWGPLKAIADNSSINNMASYLEALAQFQKHFHQDLERLKPGNPNDSITLSKAAMQKVLDLTKKSIDSLFQSIVATVNAAIKEEEMRALAEGLATKASI